MSYDEFNNGFEPVVCSPWGTKCIWQWGFMRQQYKDLSPFSRDMTFNLIDQTSITVANPLNLFFDGNSAYYYNVYDYCTNYYFPNKSPKYGQCEGDVSKKEYYDFSVQHPAAFYGGKNGISGLNKTLQNIVYLQEATDQEKLISTLLACNMSELIHGAYRRSTGYHDEFTVRFINKYKESTFQHQFKVGNWAELGYAQFGGGYVTDAMLSVRSVYNVVR